MNRGEAMLACLFPEQRAAITDPKRFKMFFCTRRAGKSFAIGVYLLITAMAFPGSSCLYAGLTKASARHIMNKDVFQVLVDTFRIPAKWTGGDESAWHLANGSVIYLLGLDATDKEIDKALGQKYRAAVLDEASKYRRDLRLMVYEALIPAMGDDLGTIILSGTPSSITQGLYYDGTTKGVPGWNIHKWSWKNNIPKLRNLTIAHDEHVKENPDIVHTPSYKREYLGQWVIDDQLLVYHFRWDLNTIDKLPAPHHEYTYVLGGDLGFSDPSAITISAYHRHDPVLYVVYAQKRANQTITMVADWVKSLWQKTGGSFPFAAQVFDAANKQAVEEMKVHHNLPLDPAEKTGKSGVIENMNAELQTSRIKLLPGTEALIDEWEKLIWNPELLAKLPPKREEHPRFPNHLADACLYGWRRSRAYTASPAPPKEPDVGTQEWENLQHQKRVAKASRFRQNGGLLFDEFPDWVQKIG